MSEGSNLVEIITAAGVALTIAGGGVKFVWTKVEARLTKIETDLKTCETRHQNEKHRTTTQTIVIELLWAEVKRLADDSPVFERAKSLLDKIKGESDEH
jgi:hypothetical protein